MPTDSAARARDVLQFWFGSADPAPAGDADRSSIWFGGGELDREIAARFGDLVEFASRGGLDDWAGTARGRLALVLLIDQFRRNLYRGSAAAYALDDKALGLVLEAIETGGDRELEPIERVFLYMPLQHSESRTVQIRSVRCFEQLLDEAPPERRKRFAGFLGYARQHHDIVARFGRFPHRNAVLGRECTADEQRWLEDGAPRFGQ